jgi:hypothetical protein
MPNFVVMRRTRRHDDDPCAELQRRLDRSHIEAAEPFVARDAAVEFDSNLHATSVPPCTQRSIGPCMDYAQRSSTVCLAVALGFFRTVCYAFSYG